MHLRVQHPARGESGYSMVELFVVLAIVAILGAIAIPQLYNSRKLYKSEEQTLQIIDLLRETGQLAITKRRNFRLEIDLTANAILIIDERNPDPAIPNTPTNSADLMVKRVPIERPAELRVDVKPAGTGTLPAVGGINHNFTTAVFATDTIGHLEGTTNVTGNRVWAARFRPDGSVVNAAGNITSSVIYVFPPTTATNTNARNKGEVRAISLFGGSGAVRYWKHDRTSTFYASQ